ncbi:MAG: metallopeptidase TldD-related protein [Candidatus Azobacteroides sp.]|nr:metallopeptidase TldD-related protein [Candidatus Azobacteroides sp.]
MNKRIFVLLLCFVTGISISKSQDAEFQTLKTELDRNFSVLKDQPIPAYYIFLRLDEIQNLNCMGRMGHLQVAPRLGSPTHVLSAGLRVGDRNLDNSHEIRGSGYGGYQDVRIGTEQIPIDNNPTVLKNAIRLQLDELYKQDIQIYEQIKTNISLRVEKEDKSPDFSVEKAESYYEAPVNWEDLHIQPTVWEDKVRNYSAIFNTNPDVVNGAAYLSATLMRKIFVDTEGREIAQNTVSFQLVLTAEALAEDGMSLPLTKTWSAFSSDELPSDDEVIQAAKDMNQMLSDLKKAPVVESFTGPAILSPAAAGVFFHEIFGHRVEGSRLKQESDAQTFKKKIGERVLPKHLSVTFDPTLKYFQKTPLTGTFKFDDEGIRGQRVEVVKNGILKDFLMSRTPIEGFVHSNGHGRAQIGAAPISRQSNLIAESSQKFSMEELVKKLRKEAKAQGKDYAYYFKEVAGGFTNTNRYSPNAFNVTPLVVYRIYTDGRPDELVRGVNLVGTPLAMFSQIEACGNEYEVFNGICGAESGAVPVACVSPALFVKQIETQKRPKSQSQPPYLSKPEKTETDSKDDVISESIRKEVDRALLGLSQQKTKPPFFISYTLGDIKQLVVSASNGSLLSSEIYPLRTGNARLLMGDYQCTDENFTGTGGGGGAYGYDGTPCLDDNEEGIRYTIWRDLDAIYKSAVETYEQKLAAIKQLNIPAKDLELPDWDQTPPMVKNDIPIPQINLNPKTYEEYAIAASSVFNEYKDILKSNVTFSIYTSTVYFYNTEKSEYKLPFMFASLSAVAMAKTEDGEDLEADLDVTGGSPGDLPSIDDFKKQCRDLAEKLLEEMRAPKLSDAYAGPVLFEDLAVVRTFYSNFFYGDNSLIAMRKPFSAEGYAYGGNRMEEMIDKRITAKEITIDDLTGTPEYNGVKLLGYTPIDAQAVATPAKLTLVENGILKTLLNDRVPTTRVPHSNGHSLLTPGAGASTNTGVVRMSDTQMKSKEELRNELFRLAKEEGYDYAYIVRNIAGSIPLELYRVNIADGTETRIRSAAITDLDFQSFKKIRAVSDKEMIYNGIVGNLISIIVPDAILFDELQIQSDRLDSYKRPPLVGQDADDDSM